MASTAASNPFSDPALMDHIVRAVAVEMAARASSTSPRLGGSSHHSVVGEGYERDGLYDLPWRRGC